MNDSKEKRRVALGVCGSIAAYKAAELARLLVSEGYEVKCLMTESAQEFITPLTMQSVTGEPVMTDFWREEEAGIGHIQLADWADTLVIAPATADVIAKMAHGISDTPILAVALATRSPILVAPAMNVNMYEHAQTQENIEKLRKRVVSFVDPGEGALACGWNGTGRLAQPSDIFMHVRRILSTQDFAGNHVVVTTGPTREAIDPVRFISNRSSGRMGIAIALEAFRRGARVTLIHGPIQLDVPSVIKSIPVVRAEEMEQAVAAYVSSDSSDAADVVVMAAAVADYRPSVSENAKIKRSGKAPALTLVENIDILGKLGSTRADSRTPVLVGFAVETGEEDQLIAEVRRKLQQKNVDVMVGNKAEESLDRDTNRVWIIDRNGRQEEVATTTKSRVANKILDAVKKL